MAEGIQASLFFGNTRKTECGAVSSSLFDGVRRTLCASKAVHAGSNPARRSMPRSFSGGTKVFEAFYVGSIPALGAKLVPAWCTVHRRIYKTLRSRLEHGLGSTPSASTMRSKLMRMSRRFTLAGAHNGRCILCA